MTSEVEKSVNKDRYVIVKPIQRSGWLPPNHDGATRFSGTKVFLVPDKNTQTRQIITGLSDEDEAYFEKKLRLTSGTLSRYNEEYWGKYWIPLDKSDRILDLNNPKDALDHLVLKSNSRVAQNLSEVNDKQEALYVLVGVEEEAQTENTKNKEKLRAIKILTGLSKDKMLGVLKIYAQVGGKPDGRPDRNSSSDFIEDKTFKKLEEDPSEFIRIATDPDFDTKVLIDDCISKRILVKTGSKYSLHGGDTIGMDLQTTIDYINDPHNQDMKIAIKQKLEAAK